MKAINWVVGLLSLSAYGIGNTAFAYPAAAPHLIGDRSPPRIGRAVPAARR
jgi:hypothetical protein